MTTNRGNNGGTVRRAIWRSLVAAAMAVGLAAWLGYALGAGSGNEVSPPTAAKLPRGADQLAPAEEPNPPAARYMGSAACSLCHDNGAPHFPTDLVKLDEYHIWNSVGATARPSTLIAARSLPLSARAARRWSEPWATPMAGRRRPRAAV